MEFLFEALKQIRKNILNTIDNLDTKKLNQIPDGFNNNILWNFAHIVTSQQLLCYKLGNVPLIIPENYIALFGRGTSPKNWNNNSVINLKELKSTFIETAEIMEKDYKNKLFLNYSEYKTSAGLILKNIDDALIYNYGHENMHYGVILSIIKAL